MKNTNLIFVIMVAIWLISMSLSAIKALSADGVVYTIDGADVTLTFTIKPPPIATVYERNMAESDKIIIRRVWL